MASIGYERVIEGSDTVAQDTARVKATLAQDRADAKARAEAQQATQDALALPLGVGSALKAAKRLWDKVTGGMVESLATQQDEEQATAIVRAALEAAEQKARDSILAALRDTRKVIEDKPKVHGADSGWHGKTVKFAPQPVLRVEQRPTGRVVVGEWDYELPHSSYG